MPRSLNEMDGCLGLTWNIDKNDKEKKLKKLPSPGTDVVKLREFFFWYSHRTDRVHAQTPNIAAGHRIITKVKQSTTGS